MTSEGSVFVTGASGFLGKHVVLTLLQAGHSVRASVRDPAMADQVRKAVAPHLDADAVRRLTFVTLDLTRDEGWGEAMEGATALFHTASPFPIAQPKDPDEVIRPAVDGTRRALEAAAKAGIERVILTSSTIAMIQTEHLGLRPFDESDWADAHGTPNWPYARSKVLAERLGWELAASKGLRLTTKPLLHPRAAA